MLAAEDNVDTLMFTPEATEFFRLNTEADAYNVCTGRGVTERRSIRDWYAKEE